MTDNPFDLEKIKNRPRGISDRHAEDKAALIAEVKALRERVAKLLGCDALDCPECGQISNMDKSGCQICGAHFSLKNFNEYVKHSARAVEAAEALNRGMRKAAKGLLDILQLGPLDAAAQYGPDFDLRQGTIDAADKVRAVLKKAQPTEATEDRA